jgi:hypothetical protein
MHSKHGRMMRIVVGFVLALTLGLAGTLAGAGKAYADTGNNQVTHVYMNLDDFGSTSQQDQYQGLLDSLRAATGHLYRGSTYVTQSSNTGLIRLSLHINSTGEQMDLWLNPSNLYVLGFSNSQGLTWQFNDMAGVLANRLGTANVPGINPVVQDLFFGGGYPELTPSAGRDRNSIQINYADVLGSVRQLSGVTNPTGGQSNGSPQTYTARSLLLMIQFTSEAARFWDVQGIFRSTMIGQNQGPGLSLTIQELENNWEFISQYGISVTQNPSTPGIVAHYVNPYLPFFSWAAVAARTALLLYTINYLPSHTEL